jgi:hypothetical protein
MTPQQQADLLLAEHQQRRRNVTLQDWDVKVKPHLHLIEAGAEITVRHTNALLCRPDFKSLSEAELGECRRVLETALADIRTAQAIYASKPRESDHAAA